MLTQSQAQQNINTAVQLHQRGELDPAASIYRSILASRPDHADALHLLGVVAKQKRQLPEAIELIERAIACNPHGPNTADYHNNCAEAYRASFQYDEAFSHYQQSLSLRGQPTVSLLFNLGGCFQELGRHEEARPCFDQAVELAPDHARAYFRRAYSHLARNDFVRGWRDYEWHVQAQTGERYIRPPWGGEILPRPSDKPEMLWSGSRTLLLCDQGLGDELCLLRFIPRLEELGTQVTYRPPAKLSGVLARNNICNQWDGNNQNFDHIFCLSDLPRLVDMRDLASLPAPVVLSPATILTQKYRDLLAPLPKPWVGITWRAGLTGESQSQIKEIPQQALLHQFKEFQGSLVILQRGITAAEEATLHNSELTVLDCSAASDQLEDALALMSLLDRYVGVANTNVHLRTSLGLATDVLTAANAIDYRWPATSHGSAWFPHCRAFRQASDGSWDLALAELQRTQKIQ